MYISNFYSRLWTFAASMLLGVLGAQAGRASLTSPSGKIAIDFNNDYGTALYSV